MLIGLKYTLAFRGYLCPWHRGDYLTNTLRESEKSQRRGCGDFLCILGPCKTWASSLVLLCITVNFSGGRTLAGEGTYEGLRHMDLCWASLVY